jgi:hypothetical protein
MFAIWYLPRQIVSVVWQLSTVNDFLSVVGEKFFNDYLRIDTKRFPISVKWNSYMYILQQIETKWDTYLEWITNYKHYPELRSYFTLKSLLHTELKQVMSLFTLRRARGVLVVALVYSFPDFFNVIMALISPNTNQPFIVPIRWTINGVVIFCYINNC